MGSELRLTAWTADEVAALAAFDAVFAEFERLDALMSVWRPGSDVLRVNAAAGDRPVALQPEVIEVPGTASNPFADDNEPAKPDDPTKYRAGKPSEEEF